MQAGRGGDTCISRGRADGGVERRRQTEQRSRDVRSFLLETVRRACLSVLPLGDSRLVSTSENIRADAEMVPHPPQLMRPSLGADDRCLSILFRQCRRSPLH